MPSGVVGAGGIDDVTLSTFVEVSVVTRMNAASRLTPSMLID
jgi:hypothetical protein